jgi:hypothetical protein
MVMADRPGRVRGMNPAKFTCLAKGRPLGRRSEMKRLRIEKGASARCGLVL